MKVVFLVYDSTYVRREDWVLNAGSGLQPVF